MIIKIILSILALVCIIVYAIAESMKDGNNIGNFIEAEEEEQVKRLREFVDDLNSQKDGGIVG